MTKVNRAADPQRRAPSSALSGRGRGVGEPGGDRETGAQVRARCCAVVCPSYGVGVPGIPLLSSGVLALGDSEGLQFSVVSEVWYCPGVTPAAIAFPFLLPFSPWIRVGDGRPNKVHTSFDSEWNPKVCGPLMRQHPPYTGKESGWGLSPALHTQEYSPVGSLYS